MNRAVEAGGQRLIGIIDIRLDQQCACIRIKRIRRAGFLPVKLRP